VVVLITALLATTGLTPLTRSVMLRHGVVDVPNARSSHASATPRGGGVACVAGALAAGLLATVTATHAPWLALSIAVALGFLGFADDRRQLSPIFRLSCQVLAGVVAGLVLGEGKPLLFLLAIAIVPAAVNVVNFMDGINGITSLTMALWGLTAYLLGRQEGVTELWVLGAIALGASLGFLPWNAPVARVFLGDVGSYFFGGIVACGLVVAAVHALGLAILAAPLSIYLADTGTTLVRRALGGRGLFVSHREHAYQRLVPVAAGSHLVVAATAVLFAGLITVSWATAPTLVACTATVLLCSAFVAAPELLRVTGSRR
jgi:UDP-N-acetylmuramyl pentapeptide phosphotransferase/UDP-N-acetylglucosamine-1-phosphate transferase